MRPFVWLLANAHQYREQVVGAYCLFPEQKNLFDMGVQKVPACTVNRAGTEMNCTRVIGGNITEFNMDTELEYWLNKDEAIGRRLRTVILNDCASVG